MDIFISYSRKDHTVAQYIARYLAIHGYNAWIEVEGIQGGANWQVEINKAIQEAELIIALVSSASITSQWVMWELGYAHASNKKILPILINKVPIRDFPMPLLNYQYLDATADLDSTLQEITQYLLMGEEAIRDAPKPLAENETVSEEAIQQEIDQAISQPRSWQDLDRHIHENSVL